jgi:hypothetical protein
LRLEQWKIFPAMPDIPDLAALIVVAEESE